MKLYIEMSSTSVLPAQCSLSGQWDFKEIRCTSVKFFGREDRTNLKSRAGSGMAGLDRDP